MARIRTAFVSGTTLNNPLAIGDVTLSSAALSSLAAVTAPDVALLVLDPAGVNGTPEVVTVTAHTAAATTATITRASEGSTARAHPVGTTWVHGPTTYDFLQGPQIVASNTTEQTTVSTSAVDLLVISNLDIPVTSGFSVRGNWRKTSGAAAVVALGLKVNATTLVEAATGATYFVQSSSTNAAENGFFIAEFGPQRANYNRNGVGYHSYLLGVGILTPSLFNANPMPVATITSVTIRGISGSGSVTLAVQDVTITEIKYALGL